MKQSFEISKEVKTALAREAPVVALESTVIAHGLPEGKGVEAAMKMAAEIEKQGCTPAIIGIIEGKIKIGLTEDEAVRLSQGKDVMKVSTREIADAVAGKRDGATTVAATAYLAGNAGISVVATGGIGGVHRGASETMDISADLWEMIRTNVIVVCSGAKSVLDLPATLEWLETHQVPVYGYGTDELPAFYSPKSGLKVPKLDTVEAVADIYAARISVGQRGGMILAVPIPKKNAIDVSDAIDQAVVEAREQGVTGPALTPWLLKRVQESSGGAAVDANIALLTNNAHVAAEVAASLHNKRERGRIGFTSA